MKSPLSDVERKDSSYILDNIKTVYPELSIIYVTSGAALDLPLYDNDALLKTNINDIEKSGKDIAKELEKVSRNLVSYYSNNYEEYVTPYLVNTYDIHKKYIKYGNIKVKFSNNEYGPTEICVYERSKNPSCKTLNLSDEAVYNPADYCTDRDDCTIIFEVTSNSTSTKCSGNTFYISFIII